MAKTNLKDRLWAAHHGVAKGKTRPASLIDWIQTGEGGEKYPLLEELADMHMNVRREAEHPRSVDRYIAGLPLSRTTQGLLLAGEDLEHDLLKVCLTDLETWIRAGTRLRVYRKRPTKPGVDEKPELLTKKDVQKLMESLQMLLDDWHTEAVR